MTRIATAAVAALAAGVAMTASSSSAFTPGSSGAFLRTTTPSGSSLQMTASFMKDGGEDSVARRIMDFPSFPKVSKTTRTFEASQDDPIVPFGGSANPDGEPDKQIVGGKGVGLQVMSKIGVDVPPGFTLTTPLCQVFSEKGDLPQEIWDSVVMNVKRVEEDMGRKFGDASNPLLFSCRSGAAVSMPGMMDTVLNIGLNSETVEGLAESTGNPRFAYDSYRRLLDMYGDVVLGIEHEQFEKELERVKEEAGVENDVDMSVEDLKKLCEAYKDVYEKNGLEFPEDVYAQLRSCIKAVFGSWQSERAIKYREINGIHNLLGTAANIQTMVFGNMGETSGTGVAFTRDPGTGENKLYGEYLINAQGEDVVAGIRTPEPISKLGEVLPETFRQFTRNIDALEKHFKDMQDIEFTIENGKLWMLQCRSGKRTGPAAMKVALDLVAEGICTEEEALLRVEPDHVKQLLHPNFTPESLESSTYKENVAAVGLPGGPGAAVGKIVFSAKAAEDAKENGGSVILVRENTSPEDVGGMWAAEGVLTARGGMTSHAAVVARGWGKPCVCGCSDLEIDEVAGIVTVKSTGQVFKEGDYISLNGSTGEVVKGAIPMEVPTLGGNLGTVLEWADAAATMGVMANADSGKDAAQAAEHGAVGIGLCRTEHMFFSPPERLPFVRQWILKGEGLDKVQEFQRADFQEIFKAMDGKLVTIRLLDPPLHEFLPQASQVDDELCSILGYDDGECLVNDIECLHEENPMLGLRGCRLAITKPEVTVMQVEAIMNAAADVVEENPFASPRPRIMIPLVGSIKEYEDQALMVKATAERVNMERKLDVPYVIGTMIEVPRAAIIADQLAALTDPADGQPLCSFFSYGTNDLTQMTMGISRDDAAAFIPRYLEKGIYTEDPFTTIDTEGVGYLVRKSAVSGRTVTPGLSLSICGEHGGDPKSIDFFQSVDLDYVSCSPYRIPIARLAAGQAAVKSRKEAAKKSSAAANAPAEVPSPAREGSVNAFANKPFKP